MSKHVSYILSALLLVTVACTNQQGGDADQQADAAAQTADAPAQRDISTATLVQIDPEIQKYEDAVSAAKKAFDAGQSADSKVALVKAYTDFGDYMQYESPVSPRQGKYHRALIEYRHALAIEPGSEKIAGEIKQIEDIYRSMGREVPGDESL
jgi:tetratricopeptide (TPR) repeat protein